MTTPSYAIRDIDIQILTLMQEDRWYRSGEFSVPVNNHRIKEAQWIFRCLVREGLVDKAKSGANYLYRINQKGLEARFNT